MDLHLTPINMIDTMFDYSNKWQEIQKMVKAILSINSSKREGDNPRNGKQNTWASWRHTYMMIQVPTQRGDQWRFYLVDPLDDDGESNTYSKVLVVQSQPRMTVLGSRSQRTPRIWKSKQTSPWRICWNPNRNWTYIGSTSSTSTIWNEILETEKDCDAVEWTLRQEAGNELYQE